jgi:hypothetical protein
MPRIVTIAVRCIWASAIIVTATGIGATYGWERHGLVAAIALGFVGFIVGAPFAIAPASSLLEFLGEILTSFTF